MLKVLLVDDHKLIRVGLRQIIEANADFEVVGEAESGQDGLEKARDLKPDVVVMDINMPGMNGIEATRRIARLDPRPRILIVSVLSRDPVPSRLLEAGADGYLSKDTAADEILTALKMVKLGKRYLSADLARQMALSQFDGDSPLDQLSDREMEVLLMVTDGQSIQEIAEILHVSPK
ncbi:MAG: response regulator, partial [Gammaproteobacteria bacterium]|nr:response regulator [Gammaproteobacteria bacterium]